MSHTPHELHEEFPEFHAKISEMKVNDHHFERLFNDYHDINRRIHRAETLVEPVSELAEVDMRKERSRLKDMLYKMLTE